MKTNQKGFSLVEGLLIFVIIGLLVFIGIYIHRSNEKVSKDLLPNSSITKPNYTKNTGQKNVSTSADATANWQSFSSTDGMFSVKYPKTWVQPNNTQYCDKTLLAFGLYLGPNADTVLKCGSDGGFGEISIDSNKENNAGFDFKSDYTNVVKKSVVVDGVTGERISAISSGQQQLLGSLPDGTIVVEYTFYTNQKFYVAHYIQKATDPDVLADFDLMITKTLRFQ